MILELFLSIDGSKDRFSKSFRMDANVPEKMRCVTVDTYTITLFRNFLSFVGLMQRCQPLYS